MRAPADLLQAAEELSSRIPLTEDYALERNISWLAVGRGWLKLDDISGALRALERVDSPRAEAQLRIAIIQWAGEHPELESARTCVRESVERIGILEYNLSRKDLAHLVPTAFYLLGEQAVRKVASELQDPFSAGNVLVTLARLQPNPGARLQTLKQAEQIADGIEGGNRDFALRWVYSGYRLAGMEEDANRIWDGMVMKPEEMDSPIRRAEEVSAQVDALLPPLRSDSETDIPLARLHRFLAYQCNDLKVQFLVDLAAAGGLSEPEVEGLIVGDDFVRIDPPRPPSMDLDPSHFDEEKFARFFFDRPVCQHGSDKDLLEAYDPGQQDSIDRVLFLNRVTFLFETFRDIAARFTSEQIEQGLWHLLGYRFFLGQIVHACDVPSEVRRATIRAMVYPFRHYYAEVGERYKGTAFFMWWDLLGVGSSDVETPVLDVLEQILMLDSKPCQFAALHGLNHLFPTVRASELVSSYLAEHRSAMDEKEIAWVEACRDGKAL